MSRSSSSSMSRSNPSKAFGMSSYSIGKTGSGPMNRLKNNNLKEELISKKITEIFKDKEQRMIRVIEQTITDDKLRVYKARRAEYEDELTELENEKKKINKRKKNKKEKAKALRANTRQQICFLVRALNETVCYYKILYYENDFYRLKRLLDMANIEKTQQAKMKTIQEMLSNLFYSPFKDDRRFMIKYLAIETRDRLQQSKNLVDNLFFDKIFNLMTRSSDEQNTLQAYDIVCNLMMDKDYRAKLRDKDYIKHIYESVYLDKIEERKLEKISHLTTLVAFHSDMLPNIISSNLLSFIIKLLDMNYSVTIRSNAVLAISLLTYHEVLFQELINNNVIDMVMDLCMDPKQEISVKRFSTLALVHFALARDSIQLLLEKGIMNLFNALSTIDNAQIHTNVSWIFLALCNNGITGKQMLMNGITRDMFLVSCNPQFSQIRHLVIAGFAELGRCNNLKENQMKSLPHTLQSIKESAIFGTQEALNKEQAPHTVDVLLRFTLSNESCFKQTAFWALKDYIMLRNDCLVDDLQGVICAFVNGAADISDKVKTECATAISFLISHHLAFTETVAKSRSMSINKGNKEYEFNPDFCYIMDALMYLTGQESLEVRTKAFSTLSSLSTYASSNEHVMTQIQHDIKMRPNQQSQDYFGFIEDRLTKSQATFTQKFQTPNIEKDYAGLYCLLRLAQEPDEAGTEEAACYLRQFYFPEIDLKPDSTPQAKKSNNEGGQEKRPVQEQANILLTEEEKRLLSVNMFSNDQLDERDLHLDELNEKFFIYVFKSLLYSQNRRILYQLLDVINFYIKHETPHQAEVIIPSTILWMLQIIDSHKDDYDLCLLAAKTVLKVVTNHQIVFDYQEMAIIKKFNKALENIGQDSLTKSDNSSTEEMASPKINEAQSTTSVIIKDATHTIIKTASSPDLSRISATNLNVQALDDIEDSKDGSGDLSINSKISKFEQGLDAFSKAIDSDKQSIDDTNKHSDAEVRDISRDSHRNTEKVLTANRSVKEIVAQNVVRASMTQVIDAKELYDGENSIKSFDNKSQLTSTHKKRSSIFGQQSHRLKADLNGSVVVSQEDQVEEIDGKQAEQQAELRDAIIKSFMVIFTNEKSQHLLLNKDIIEIAFSCLENVFQISNEAKHNLANLISIIFKFPQVQERLMNEGIILGIVYLLQQPEIHKSKILQNVVTACSYISLNFNFVNSRLSLNILQALVPILNQLLNVNEPPIEAAGTDLAASFGRGEHLKSRSLRSSADAYLEQRLQSQIITVIDKRRERDNCIFAISNLLKGHPENAKYFIECDGARLIMHEVLRLKDSPKGIAREIIELTMCCIKQVTEQKPIFRQFLSFSEENLNLLPACLEKCFAISDAWHTCTSEILIFKKLFADEDKYIEGDDHQIKMEREAQEKKAKKLDSEQIQNIDYQNIEKMKMLEKLEEKEDKSFKMAHLCKLRSHCYTIAASCIKNSFSQEFLSDRCNVLYRIMSDLKKDTMNDFIFQNLIDILRALKKDRLSIRRLYQEHALELIDLIHDMKDSHYKRLSIIKTMIYLFLKAPEELCSIDSQIFGKFFQLAVDIEDDEVTENILWLQSALIEVNCTELQHEKAIEMCTEFKSAEIYAQCLQSQNETIVLQALKGLKSLAAIPQFKAIILIDIGDELFPSLAGILSSRLSNFTLCPLEIEVELIGFLAQITESSAASKDPLTIAAKRRAVQQGFMEHFLLRIGKINYIVAQDIDMLDNNCAEISNLDLLQVKSSSILAQSMENQGNKNKEILELENEGDFAKCQPLPYFDGIERENGTNRLIENTINLAANVTELVETHQNLVHGKAKILNLTLNLLNHLVSQSITVESEQIDMMDYSIGNRQICNSLSKIILNLCMSSQVQLQGQQSIQDICVADNIGSLLVHVCRSLIDYELHSNLFRAMCLLAISPNSHNRTHFVESECLNVVQQAAESNPYFRVRRICTKVLDQVSNDLLELNEKLNRKKRKSKKNKIAEVSMKESIVNIQQ